jgi:1,4-alpha-glucan branching enzyme
MHDPANPKKVRNEHDTFNSILEVTETVTFRLEGFEEAEKVILAGTFNDWKENELLMRREGEAWILHLDLTAGKHWYKFIVDGRWMVDPQNPLREQDREGHVNSVLIVN